MRRASHLSESDEVELDALIEELAARVRSSPGMSQPVRNILTAAMKQACKLSGAPVPELMSGEILRAIEAKKQAAFESAARSALTRFLGDIEAGQYKCACDYAEVAGSECIFARATEVFAQYIPSRELGVTHQRFKRWLVERGMIMDRVGERAINGSRVGHLTIFLVDRIRDLTSPSSGMAPVPEVAAETPIDPNEAEEMRLLATVLKTYFLSPYKGKHFAAKVKGRKCLLATPDDVHEFCLHHHATMDIADHRMGPRGLKAAVRRHGLLQADNYWLKRDGKMHGHLLAFDVKLVEDFYGRHAPAPD